MAILISCASVPSERELRRRVLFGFVWEKLLSTEAVETCIVKPIEDILDKFGNMVTSISFVISSQSCSAMYEMWFTQFAPQGLSQLTSLLPLHSV